MQRAWDWKKRIRRKDSKAAQEAGLLSCDWDRERFTMDEGCTKAVTKVFVDLYEQGPYLPRETG